MKRVLLLSSAVVLLAIWGITNPSWRRGVELSSGEFDSNSDCIVRGDVVTYHTPGNLIDGILGGHGRGYETLQFNKQAYRAVFSPGSEELELVRVHGCDEHLGGEPFAVDGKSVDVAIVSRQGRVVLDRTPDRGLGPVKELIVRVPWEKDYRLSPAETDLDTFDIATPLVGPRLLVTRGMEPRGRGVTYEVYDYAALRRMKFQIPESAFPSEFNKAFKIKAGAG